MSVEITGGCLCGEVRYRATQAAVWSHNCHCSRCRRATGAAFASHLFVPEDALVGVPMGSLDGYPLPQNELGFDKPDP